MLIVVLVVLLTLQPCIAKPLTGTVTCNGEPYPDAKVQKWKCALMRTYMLNSKDLLSDSISLTYELSNKKHTFEFCGEL
ncbi:hypothetical protein Q1695_006871 [Nippostrongylus brasiliensis]|nr:hypothetical protein Q1695_006871 [Nippostrongylus brasiliensis]